MVAHVTEESSGLTTAGRLSSGQFDPSHAAWPATLISSTLLCRGPRIPAPARPGLHTALMAPPCGAGPWIRPYAAGDAEQLAGLVQRCLVEVNSRDYPADVIAGLSAAYTAAQFAGLARRRHIYIAECGAVLAGTVSRERNTVFTMFVDPRWAARGIGRQLMRHAEQQAAAEGHDHMETAASITAHAFYLALGYTDVRESETGFGLTYLMRKPLPCPSPT